MTPENKETLKNLLIDVKAIVDMDDPNPYTGIFLNNLCAVIDEFDEIKTNRHRECINSDI